MGSCSDASFHSVPQSSNLSEGLGWDLELPGRTSPKEGQYWAVLCLFLERNMNSPLKVDSQKKTCQVFVDNCYIHPIQPSEYLRMFNVLETLSKVTATVPSVPFLC